MIKDVFLTLSMIICLFSASCESTNKKNIDSKRFVEASKNGNLTVLKELLKEGVDINNQVQGKFLEDGTGLHHAVLSKNLQIVKFLVANGGNVNAKIAGKRPGATPLLYAAYGGNLAIFQYLLESGADVNQLDYRQCPPANALKMAALGHNWDIVKFLLKYKPFISKCKDLSGQQWALVMACEVNRPDMVKLLIPFALKTIYGEALKMACEHNSVKALEVLLKNGANLNELDGTNRTLLDYTIENGNEKMINFLKAHGAKTAAELKAEKEKKDDNTGSGL